MEGSSKGNATCTGPKEEGSPKKPLLEMAPPKLSLGASNSSVSNYTAKIDQHQAPQPNLGPNYDPNMDPKKLRRWVILFDFQVILTHNTSGS